MPPTTARSSFISISEATRRFAALVCGVAAAAVATEVVLHALPYSTGYGATQVDSDHPIGHGTPNFPYTYSRDWSFHLANSGTLNNEGFRASRDYRPDSRGLAVVGNSFVQSDAVLPPDTMTERIGALLGRSSFGVGSDGFSIADYSVAARWAIERFGVHTVLVLLTTEDLSHSCVPRSGQHYLTMRDGQLALEQVPRAPPSSLKRLLNRSSLFRYLFDNLHFPDNWARGWRRNDPNPQPAPDGPQARGCATGAFETAATEFLLNSFRELQTRNAARIVFILAPDYHQRHAVFGAYRDVDAFADRAEQEGFKVTRLKDAFESAERTGVKVTLAPIDRHWSAAANEIAALTVAASLR
jgi:hypothetical protein